MKLNRISLILWVILLMNLALRLPALWTQHIENDEVIYQTLADQVLKSPLNYTLRGSPILKNLPKMNYDQPLFHRPPLFVYLLALFRSLLGVHASVLISILAGALTVVALFGLAKELYGEQVALIAAAALSFCPFLLFCSTRILIDALLVFLLTSTLWILTLAFKKKNKVLFCVAGVMWGLAILTKEPGLLLIFPCAYLFFKEGINREKGVGLFCFGACAFIIVLPWYLWFFSIYKTLFPWWARNMPENLTMFPFIKMVINRPWYFYFQNISLAAPLYVFAWLGALESLKKRSWTLELVWALSFLIPLTIYGLMGEGYQTRYILPAMPAMSILVARFLSHKKEVIWALAIFLMAIGFLTGIVNSFIFYPADIFPLYYFFNI